MSIAYADQSVQLARLARYGVGEKGPMSRSAMMVFIVLSGTTNKINAIAVPNQPSVCETAVGIPIPEGFDRRWSGPAWQSNRQPLVVWFR